MTDNSEIHPTAVLDQPYRKFQGGKAPYGIEYRNSSFGRNIGIGPGVVLGKGVVLGDGVVIDSHCIVEPNATIGHNTLLIYRAVVGGEAIIGPDCVIGGFVAEGCLVGPRCRVFGHLIHRHLDTTQPWDEHEPEESAIVEEGSFIGFGAMIIGGVRIGQRAYVTAGALISRDVPAGFVAWGQNRIMPGNRWPGKLPQVNRDVANEVEL